MKKNIVLLIVLIVIFFGISIYYAVNKYNADKKSENTIKIGSTLPLTGNSAVWGVPTKEGIELAMHNYNAKGGYKGSKIEVVFEDTKADPKTGVSAINKLISSDKVSAIIDNSNSSVTLAMAPIANNNKVILLPTGSSSPDITNAGDFIFRIWNSDALEGKVIANFIYKTECVKNISLIVVNNNYGIGLKESFVKQFSKLQGKINTTEYFDETTTDFKTIASKVLESKPEGIYIVCYPKQGAGILKQLKELGNTAKLYGAVAFEDNQLLELAGNAANGLKFPLPSPVDTTERFYLEFKNDFEKYFRKDVPFLAAEGFDGFNVIMKAIELSGGYSGPDIKKGLSQIKNYKGVSGLIEFDENGDVNKPFGIREVKNNKFQWYLRKY